MTAVNVTVSTKAATNLLRTFAKQLPYATMLAANDLAALVRQAETDAIPGNFKHPRTFTANSVRAKRASLAAPLATVFIRPEVAKYLQPYESGGLHVSPDGSWMFYGETAPYLRSFAPRVEEAPRHAECRLPQ